MSQDWTDNPFNVGHVWDEDLDEANDNFDALKSSFAGSSTPANAVAGMWWYNSGTLYMRLFDGTIWHNVFNASTGRIVDTDQCSGITITAGTGLSGGGALSADRTISHAAHNGDVTGTASLAFAEYNSGNYVLYDSGEFYNSYSSSMDKKIEIYMPRGGMVRTQVRVQGPNTGTSYAAVYVNGSLTGAMRSNSNDSTWATYTENISVSAGDLLQLYSRLSTYATSNLGLQFKVACGNPHREIADTL